MGHSLITDIVSQERQDEWFTPEARSFPVAIGRFVYEVARRLNANSIQYADDLRLSPFIQGFIDFIHESKSHVATLNYDTLLYSAFNGLHQVGGQFLRVCDGWDGALVDGYTHGAGFCEENFDRRFDRNFGFYLHLHGSPLFVGSPARKLTRAGLDNHEPESAQHIILSDGRLKPFLITRSPVLSLYWRQLTQALKEAEEIIIFGYGGGDEHLNRAIKFHDVPKRVVVWDGQAGNHADENDPESLWRNRLCEAQAAHTVQYIPMNDILDFRDW